MNASVFFMSMFNRITFIIFLFSSFVVSQTRNRDFDKEMNYQSKAVRDLKNEIAAKRKKLQSEEKRERYAAQTIMNIEEEISLVERPAFLRSYDA